MLAIFTFPCISFWIFAPTEARVVDTSKRRSSGQIYLGTNLLYTGGPCQVIFLGGIGREISGFISLFRVI